MKHFLILFTIAISSCSSLAQTLDYNLKKGYIAKGYDVVSYFNNKAIEGDKKFTASFEGAKYKFLSEENLNIFNKNPEKYVPQYGGYCAYAIGKKNDKVSIDPETFQIKDGKLYLFYNAWGINTLELWKEENEDVLKEKADNNWETIKFKK